MFLSPLNWYYAKFASFAWKLAADPVQKRGSAPAQDPRGGRPAGSAPASEPNRPEAVEEH